MNKSMVIQIDDLLPQTQCQECGYDGCLPYATAIVEQGESINKCRVGGSRVITDLSKLLNMPALEPYKSKELPRVAVIDESKCIGCTMCLKACPTDAVIGAPKQSHTILAHDCTGCRLCLTPCPTDCIDIVNLSEHFMSEEEEVARVIRVRELFNKKQERVSQQRKKRIKLRTASKKLNAHEGVDKTFEKLKGRLSPEQLAKIQAARQRSQTKYKTLKSSS